jgi:hypothetical protein
MTNSLQEAIQPALETIQELLSKAIDTPNPPNLVPVYAQISSDLINPSAAYLKILQRPVQNYPSYSKVLLQKESSDIASSVLVLGRYSKLEWSW